MLLHEEELPIQYEQTKAKDKERLVHEDNI